MSNTTNVVTAALISPKEAATILSLSERSVVRLCASGELPAVKLGGSWRINRAALCQLIGVDERHDG